MSGQDDLLVGIPVAGRSLEGGDSLVGYCTHLVPVRCRIDWQQPFVDYLRTVRGTLLRAYQHQDYPFARLIEKMELHRDGRRAPLVSALFNLDRPGAVPEMTGLDVGWRSQPIAFTAFDLVFNLTELDDALVLECDYNGDIFEASTAERLVGHFHTLLKAIVANPEGGVAALQLMEEDEWRRVVVECNQTERDYPRDRCLHQLFEERAAADAQAIAVAWEGGHLSYGQLNARANQLAHRLRALGMGSEAIVGVYTTRSPETVVAIVLRGLSGPRKVAGKSFGAEAMTPFGEALKDEEIAAVITFVRNEWGNTPDNALEPKAMIQLVADTRKKIQTSGHTGAWTKELLDANGFTTPE